MFFPPPNDEHKLNYNAAATIRECPNGLSKGVLNATNMPHHHHPHHHLLTAMSLPASASAITASLPTSATTFDNRHVMSRVDQHPSKTPTTTSWGHVTSCIDIPH